MFIKSNKLLILVTTLCIMVTNNSNASDNIEKLDVNNIEHGSSFLVSNLETVIEIHCNNEDKLNHNNTNLEHSNLGRNNSEYQINRHHVNHKCNNNDNTHQIEHSENNLKRSNNEVHHNNSEHNNHEKINIEKNENNHNNNANNNVRHSSEQEQNNNDAIALNINEQDVKADDKKKESACNSLTTICSGIIVVPVSLCSYIISVLKCNIKDNVRNMLRDASIAVMKPAFEETLLSLKDCIILSCGKLANIGTNAIGGAKSYVVRKTCG